MAASAQTDQAGFDRELRALFYQRTHVSLWLGMVFFLFFSLLDLAVCREYFVLFFLFRLGFVLLLLAILHLLRLPAAANYVRPLVFLALLLGSGAISLMATHLGGFISDYYVGILLMMAGSIAVLPLTGREAALIGFSMYSVYLLILLAGAPRLESRDLAYAVNDSFFFFAVIAITALQCFDDMRVRRKTFQAKENLKSAKQELTGYTTNLEELVHMRLEELEESDLRFKDLYDNILDLVVLLDSQGIVRMANRRFAEVFDWDPQRLLDRPLVQLVVARDRDRLQKVLVMLLEQGEDIRGQQLQMITDTRRVIDVEISGNLVDMRDGRAWCQLVIRDITATKNVEREVLASNHLIDTSRRAAILGLAKLAEYRDNETGAHLERIREYTRILAGELALSPTYARTISDGFVEDIYISSVLHDIGKVGIPDSILLKPGPLTREEFERMKMHCEFGAAVLAEAEQGAGHVSFLAMGREIAMYHHEKWDGTGYPEGLARDAIPLSARIVALADVYDALTSRRCYKPAFNHEKSRDLIIRESGCHFDPEIINAFLVREQEFKRVRMESLLN
ncbi:MAG TPA: HD domain-containing protein [Desulfobulbus sp.]|nr:HD domain-containing protein [Desulfobulbus sp.]